MSLISCPECAKDISRYAEVCPFCGFPDPSSGSPQDKERSEPKLEKEIEPTNPGSLKEVPRKTSLFKGWGEVGKALRDDAEQLKETYGESDFKKNLDDAVVRSKDYLDEKGVIEKAAKAYDATQDHLDTVAGTKLLRLVEERLELQAKYNDILATKLQEALNRIEALERRNDESK